MRASSLPHSFAVALAFLFCLDITVALSAGSRAGHNRAHKAKRHTKCSNVTTTAGSLASNTTTSASKAHGLGTSSTSIPSSVLNSGIEGAGNGSSACQAAVSVITSTTTSTVLTTVTITASSSSGSGQGSVDSGVHQGSANSSVPYQNKTSTSVYATKTSASVLGGTGTADSLGKDSNVSNDNGVGGLNSTMVGNGFSNTTQSSIAKKAKCTKTSTSVTSAAFANNTAYNSFQITKSTTSQFVGSTSVSVNPNPVAHAANSTSSYIATTSQVSNGTSSVVVEAILITTASPSVGGTFAGNASTGSVSNSTSSNSVDLGSSDNGNRPASQGFWAGAGIDTLTRQMAIEGRTFYDYDGKTVKDPFTTLGESHFNSFRLETFPQYSSNDLAVNHTDELARELMFELDFTDLPKQVRVARKAIDSGLKKFMLTINMGTKIPEAWMDYTYAQMVEAIKQETKRQLQPFLDARILPDMILFENEGSWGMLYTEPSGVDRGQKGDNKSNSQLNAELCGKRPFGSLNSYPQLAGFYKAEAQACNEAIRSAGFDPQNVRYGLHSHTQYVDWKVGQVYNTQNADFEKTNKDADGNACDFTGVIPAELLSASAADVLDIMGFSSYPDPMAFKSIPTEAEMYASFGRLNKTLSVMAPIVERYGRWEDGPFKGQYKKQALGCEFAMNFGGESEAQVVAKSRHTEMLWDITRGVEFFLGMLWWEPWYCFSNWEGGDAMLCHNSFENGGTQATPIDSMKIWGRRAVSPWN